MTDTFKAKGNTKKMSPVLGKQLEDFALAQANEFLAAGQSPREACSLVANLFLHAAWVIAATGAISEYAVPDKDKFRARVEDALASIDFHYPPVDNTGESGDN